MTQKSSFQFSVLESAVIIKSLKFARRDYYSVICEHNVSPFELFELQTLNKTIKRLEAFRIARENELKLCAK
jgi:hypothetical protein